MTNIKAPCFNCQNRQVGCHGNCQAYLDYDKKNKQINIKKMNHHNRENLINDCLSKATKAKLYLGW